MAATPQISVLMSVYNGERFLTAAMESILTQTFRDFEFIIINDGSTDASAAIIAGFDDPRIRVVTQKNQGLVMALNTGVEQARGSYIARMDADDLAAPERLAAQLEYLEAHPDCSLLATRVAIIDDAGLPQPDWAEDAACLTPAQIRAYLPTSNCLAHPSIMAPATVLKAYRYRPITGSEDYDLWLRLAADGKMIAKLNRPLLSYRLHDASVTQTANQRSVTRKLLAVKRYFLAYRLARGKLNAFDRSVVRSVAGMVGGVASRRLKQVAAVPVAAMERTTLRVPVVAASHKPAIAFVVPWLTTGGADKVILDLVRGLSQYQAHILTTERHAQPWTDRFTAAGAVVTHVADHVRLRRNFAPFVAGYMARNRVEAIIISNSMVGYQAAPLIKRRQAQTKIIDILHGQGGRIDDGSAPRFSYPYRGFLDHRVTVTDYLRHYMEHTYGLPADGFTCIHNGIDLAPLADLARTTYRTKLKLPSGSVVVAWVGRLSDEKKPLLALQMAAAVLKTHPDCHFVMAGDGPQRDGVRDYVDRHRLGRNVHLLGTIDDPETLIAGSDIVLMTSEMEGYSLVLVEAQALGIPVVASDVGGNGEVVQDGRTGRLFAYGPAAVASGAAALERLIADPALRHRYAAAAGKTAPRFAIRTMIEAYEALITA